MMIEIRKKILEKYEVLNFENQKLVGIAIAKAILPIINFVDNDNVINVYKYYLNRLIDKEDEDLYTEYIERMSEFFEDVDYDIYLANEDSGFQKYLCFVSSEILGSVLMSRKVSNINIAINNFIKMNEVIDDCYYHKLKQRETIDSLEILLSNISHRTMQNRCEKFLENIIDLYSIGINNMNINRIEEEINRYSNKLEEFIGQIF